MRQTLTPLTAVTPSSIIDCTRQFPSEVTDFLSTHNAITSDGTVPLFSSDNCDPQVQVQVTDTRYSPSAETERLIQIPGQEESLEFDDLMTLPSEPNSVYSY